MYLAVVSDLPTCIKVQHLVWFSILASILHMQVQGKERVSNVLNIHIFLFITSANKCYGYWGWV